ncbi:class I SAM-dependent methyltransferase [Parasphingorhabdus sp.]|uniref:class I SAM-dependent methyltransferase n=1 Tax=Parasphingorhabdus sp. TaxID=2709688 RepID=UPI003D2D935B
MEVDRQVAEHYQHGNLLKSIAAGLDQLGKSPADVTIEDLAPVDEFHIGGRIASKHFLDQLELAPDMQVLDVGCGLGGAARYAAENYQVDVTGVDLTAEYIETGQILCDWVDLSKRVVLQIENALSMSFENACFDRAYMMHVGMNIEDKHGLFAEIYRVLAPGAIFGIYDIMQGRSGDLSYPVPWATSSTTSWLADSEKYKQSLQHAGFTIVSEQDRRDFALQFLDDLQRAKLSSSGLPPLGLHNLMQDTASEKITHMVENIAARLIAPHEIIVRKV